MNAMIKAVLNGPLPTREKQSLDPFPLGDCQLVDKHKVACGFDKAASGYNNLAKMQQEIADYGLSMLANMNISHAQCIVDIGCGTASSLEKLASTNRQQNMTQQIIGLDISMNMLRQANENASRHQQTKFTAINGDAERLPIQSSSVDVVYSSMAMQWCDSPHAVLNEISRVLQARGKALLCILTGESFSDLHKAWQHIGLPSRVNQFHHKQLWLDAAHNVKAKVEHSTKQFTSYHESIIDMLSSIKRIGANTRIAESAKASHYISKQEVKDLTRYMKQREDNQHLFPLRYQLLFLEIKK
jgi:malonyl-CoA O-methyltransferase